VEVNVEQRASASLPQGERPQTRPVVLGVAAGLLVFGLAGRAQAQEERLTGFELGGRVGYGLPFGKAADNDSDLKDSISGQVPLWLDVGYRVAPNVMVGGYFSYGFGLLGNELEDLCDVGDCSTHDMRLGGQLQFHVQPGQEVDPWFGAGVGYEWLTFVISSDVSDTDLSITGHGFEFLNLQAGLDFVVGNGGIGPFMAFTLGQYDTTSSSCSGDCAGVDEDSESIDDKALHQWLFFGVRGTFVLGAN
jgi:hypothetical protein